MQIAFIGQRGLPAVGEGVERAVEALAVELAALGHEVSVYARASYTHPKITLYRGVRVVHTGGSRGRFEEATHQLSACLHALFRRYDVIHVQPTVSRFLLLCLRFLKRRTLIVLSLDAIDQPPAEMIPLLLAPHLVIVPRETQADFLKDYYGVPAVAIAAGISAARTQRTDRLAALGLKENNYLVSGGDLTAASGAHWLIKAFIQLEDTSRIPNNFKLVLTGDLNEDREYGAFLSMLSGGRDSIVFAGRAQGETLRQLYSHASLAACPGHHPASLESLRRALGYALPTVAVGHALVREIARDSAVLCDPKSADSLMQELSYLLNNQEERARLSEAASEDAAARLSWQAVARETAEAYETARRHRSAPAISSLHHRV